MMWLSDCCLVWLQDDLGTVIIDVQCPQYQD